MGLSRDGEPASTTHPQAAKPAFAFNVVQVPSVSMRGSFRLSFDGVDYTGNIGVGDVDSGR
jgi:hypothetical protein